jgi:uncharacterized membrane protein
MKIIAGLIILWCSFPLAAHGQGKGHGVEVRAAMPLLSEAAPGSTISGSFLITNTGAGVVTVVEELQLPPGWIPITPQYLLFSLNVREQQTRTVAFTVPADAAMGSYRISYGVRGQSESGIADSESVTVTVVASSRPASGAAPAGQQRKEDESRMSGVSGGTEKALPRLAVEPQPAPDGMIGDGSQPVADEQGKGVEVRAAGGLSSEVTPGKVVTGSFLVTNTGSRAETLVDELRIPPGWETLIPQAAVPFTLNAGERRARIIAFSVPSNAPAGSYRLTYGAHGNRDPDVSGSRSFAVVVMPVHRIEIVVAEKPDFVVAGKPFTVRVRVMNRGNSAARIRMDLRGNLEYPVAPQQTALTLAAGQSELVTVTVTTNDLLKRKETYVLNIKAVTETAQGVPATVTKDAVLFILPGKPEQVDLYQRVPARLTMIGALQDGQHGGQAELAGGGNIDEEGKKRIDFLFRGPDLQNKNIFGLREEYRFNYFGETLNVLAGDQGYSLSPLTEQSRYGRGGGVNFRRPTFGAGGFYLTTPGQSPQVKEAGGYLAYQPIDRLGLKANVLHKETDPAAFRHELTTNLYSIEASTAWDKKLALDLEYGYGDNSGVTRTNGNGYRIDLKGELGGARYVFEKTYADPRFFGYYRDSDYTSGALSFPLYQKLIGNISYRSYQNNLDLDPLVGSAADEESYRGGFSLPLPTGTNFSLAYEDYRKKDRMAFSPQFNFRERFFTAGAGQTFKWASLQGYLVSGIIDNNLTGSRNNPVENYSLYASFFPTARQAYSLYARAGQDLYGDSPQRTKSVGVNATWRYQRASLNLNYQINNMASDTNGRADVLMSSLIYTLPNNHAISFRSRWISSQNGVAGETSYLLSYTIPLGIPVGKKKGIGGIEGTVSDAEGKPLPKVVVEVGGLTAMTDSDGGFTFPGFKPGSYYLTVEQGSIGMGRITTEKMPLSIEVKGGETSRVSIEITPSCRVNGRLSLRQSDHSGNVQREAKPNQVREFSLKGLEGAGNKDKSALKLVNILVEISRDGESIRQVTDDEGRFSFYDLRPGRWTVKVADDNLPPYHYVEKESYPVELKSGEDQVVVIQVLPRVRKIQMIDEGKIR